MGHLIPWSAVENLVTGVPLDAPATPPVPRDEVVAASPAVAPPSPFWARMGAEMTRQPARVVVACLATVLAPAVVAHAGSLSPQAAVAPVPASAPAAEVGPPRPGDPASWLAVARQAAAACPGLPASVLVAVAQVETGLGVASTTSAAGAVGPMQFLPSTWAAYGADGDGDGVADPRNPADALSGAARLLCANGGGDSARLPSAVWNYNHSDEYVRQVLGAARLVPSG